MKRAQVAELLAAHQMEHDGHSIMRQRYNELYEEREQLRECLSVVEKERDAAYQKLAVEVLGWRDAKGVRPDVPVCSCIGSLIGKSVPRA